MARSASRLCGGILEVSRSLSVATSSSPGGGLRPPSGPPPEPDCAGEARARSGTPGGRWSARAPCAAFSDRRLVDHTVARALLGQPPGAAATRFASIREAPGPALLASDRHLELCGDVGVQADRHAELTQR